MCRFLPPYRDVLLLFVSSLPRTKTMPGLCLWAGTRAARTLREQLAAPSNIHERDGKTVKDSVDPGIQNGRQSVCSQRLMGLIWTAVVCTGHCLCLRGGLRWATIMFLSPVTLLFWPVCSNWPDFQFSTAAGSAGFILLEVYSVLHCVSGKIIPTEHLNSVHCVGCITMHI